MAFRRLNTNDVLRGRIQAFRCEKSGSEVFAINKLKDGAITVNEEVKSETYELADGQEIREEYGRKVIAELVIDEVKSADITTISNSNYLEVQTEKGGTGSGIKFIISGSDYFKASLEDMKTKITVERSVESGLPYSSSYM